MSRSIHTTWKKISLENQFQYSDSEHKDNHLNKMYEDMSKKRMIKKQKLIEREQDDTFYKQVQFLDPSTINIEIQDEREFIHYPASKDDIVEIMKRLPLGVLSGLDSIVFCLGKEYQERCIDEYDEEIRDPYTGRLSCEDNGVVFSPPILGTYFSETCKIFLYAYVYDKKRLALDIIEPFFRLQMLSTFAHEVGHHDDNMRRTGRGRWLGLNEWKCENYAELKQMEWSRDVIVPYLFERYPNEYENLSRWIEEHGGVKFPLEILAGESKGRRIGDLVSIGFSATSAVEELFINVIQGKSIRDTTLEFAWDLHIGDYYEECLVSLDSLLTRNPHDSEVMGVKADTLIHLERYNEAEIIASECLLIDRNNTDALEALCDVYQHLKDWKALKETSNRGIEIAKISEGETKYREIRAFAESNIIAVLYLGEFDAVRESIKLLPENISIQQQRKNAFIALATFCEGNYKGAMDIAKSTLIDDDVVGPAKAILKGVYNSAAYQIGACHELYSLSEYESDFLEWSDIKELLDR